MVLSYWRGSARSDGTGQLFDLSQRTEYVAGSLGFARFCIRSQACTVASRCLLKEKIVAVAIDQYAVHLAKQEQLEQVIPAPEQTPAGISLETKDAEIS